MINTEMKESAKTHPSEFVNIDIKTKELWSVEEKTSYLLIKRLFDITLAFIGILVLLPVFICVALLIKIEDGGNVIFSQTRIGVNGKKFKMYKFRSMVPEAESKLNTLLIKNDVSGAMFKLKEDPRVTKVGKVIRSYSIDELPQLLNVIKGDMSLVGPRPPLEREVALYTAFHLRRLSVVPGCTGLWQATVRNSVGFEEMVELDIKYIEQRSFSYDVIIILMTFKSILFNRAY
ncbi:sugar transferase [Exiguobacterium sp. s7]|uniref:sugar transferase n=1 Tax=Exiguobacterium sp. s7 TaxID=2751235 RepID=UPI002036BF48|nr:sugar transferase [Exiguobacterium sp. s7]